VDVSALLATFPPDSPRFGASGIGVPAPVAGVVEALGGVSLSGGMYRVFDAEGVRQWTSVAADGFPTYRDRATVFAADWLGRLLAADAARRDGAGRELVVMLEPGTAEVLEVPCTVEAVHTSELLEAADALVAAPFYEQWRAATGDTVPLTPAECVGYRVPLFLGGADTIENVERGDMEVYWSLSAQAAAQAASRPEGTPISSVSASPKSRRLWRR
jgi:hypothetical protein